jgi:quinohemoprotein ethanol dehydrogenase
MAGSWLTYGLTQGETRYSPLRQIDASNVARLGLAWSYEVGAGGGNQEATPLVWNNTIYGITTYSVVFAVDARTGKPVWRWDPELNQAAVRTRMCCGVLNRGLALANGMLFAPVNDGRLVALDALTGRVKWEARVAYPQDWYSLTIAPRIAGNKVVVGVAGGDHPTRGFIDVLDRVTGEFISAAPFVQVNWTRGFDEKTGRPFLNPEAFYDDKTPVQIYPTGGGAHNWAPMSYNPATGLVYLPASQGSYTFLAADEVKGYPFGHPGVAFPGRDAKPVVPPIIGPEPLAGQRGVLEAWDPVNQKLVWRTPGGGASGGGTLTTASNLVFQVINDGRLVAYSADKGEKLVEIRTNRNGAAPPVTYVVDGRQYVAFLAGTGRPAQGAGPTDAKVDNAPTLFVFEVGGTAALPPPPPPGQNPFGAPPPPPATAPH